MTVSEPATGGPTPRQGLLAVTTAAILWGSIGIAVRLLQDGGLSSAAVAFWRYVTAVVVLLPLVVLRSPGQLRVLTERPARVLAVAGSSLAFQLLYFVAVRNVGAGVATLVTLGVAPVALHAAEAVMSRTVPGRRTLAVLLIALAGLALVTTGTTDPVTAPRPDLGVLQAVGSGLAFAFSTLWSRPLLTRVRPLSLTLLTTVSGLLVLLPVVAVLGWEVPRGGAAWITVAWLGLVTTVAAYGLFYLGLRHVTGGTAMIVTLLEPVTAVALAALLLGEALTVSNVAGGALLMLAVASLYLRGDSAAPTRSQVTDE